MKYYKIVNPNGHRGLVYKEGLNIDRLPFNPSGNCMPGGIYFASEDIFAFLDYGSEVYEVVPVGDIYENPGSPKKWKAHKLEMKYIGKWKDINVFKKLIEDGADIHAHHNKALRCVVSCGYLEIVKFLVDSGADIHDCYNSCINLSIQKGHLEITKFLIKSGASTSALNNENLGLVSSVYGHLDMVKFLIESSTIISIDDKANALKLATKYDRPKIVEYLKSIIEKENK